MEVIKLQARNVGSWNLASKNYVLSANRDGQPYDGLTLLLSSSNYNQINSKKIQCL